MLQGLRPPFFKTAKGRNFSKSGWAFMTSDQCCDCWGGKDDGLGLPYVFLFLIAQGAQLSMETGLEECLSLPPAPRNTHKVLVSQPTKPTLTLAFWEMQMVSSLL